MKQHTNKMLYEKAAAMVRAMDEKYEKYEACRKATEHACGKACDYAAQARKEREEAKMLVLLGSLLQTVLIGIGAAVWFILR